MIKLILLDMDGTIYIENELIEGVIPFFEYLKKNNIHYVFITNNSSKSISTYLEKLNMLNIPAKLDNMYTSVEVTINYLKNNNYKTIYSIGTKDFNSRLENHFQLYDGTKDPDVVVLAFDTELYYEKLVKGVEFLRKGIPFVATNPDLKCPVGKDEYIPDCGSMAKLLTDATGVEPKFLGKPDPTIVKDLLLKYNLQKNEVLLVGDRLYTDILCGINAGVKTVAVLTGETTKEEIKASCYKPSYVVDNIYDVIKIIEKENKVDENV